MEAYFQSLNLKSVSLAGEADLANEFGREIAKKM
jgi:hypothetical protein